MIHGENGWISNEAISFSFFFILYFKMLHMLTDICWIIIVKWTGNMAGNTTFIQITTHLLFDFFWHDVVYSVRLRWVHNYTAIGFRELTTRKFIALINVCFFRRGYFDRFFFTLTLHIYFTALAPSQSWIINNYFHTILSIAW